MSIEGLDGVDRVQVDLGWLQRLNAMTDLLGRAVWALALLLAAAVVLGLAVGVAPTTC